MIWAFVDRNPYFVNHAVFSVVISLAAILVFLIARRLGMWPMHRVPILSGIAAGPMFYGLREVYTWIGHGMPPSFDVKGFWSGVFPPSAFFM